jgi:small-conductance mechanosensitive channel
MEDLIERGLFLYLFLIIALILAFIAALKFRGRTISVDKKVGPRVSLILFLIGCMLVAIAYIWVIYLYLNDFKVILWGVMGHAIFVCGFLPIGVGFIASSSRHKTDDPFPMGIGLVIRSY